MRFRHAAAATLATVMLFASCGSSGSETTDDRVAWCRAVTNVTARFDVLEPGFEADAGRAVSNLGRALSAALEAAPEPVTPDLARVADLARLLDAELATGARPDEALEAARQGTDQPRVEAALEALEAEASACDR